MAAVEIISSRQLTDDDWMLDAACKGLTHLFFPTPAERPQARERREATAREVCASCHVRSDCHDFAHDQHEYGFWGGESEDERHTAGFRLIAPIGVRARLPADSPNLSNTVPAAFDVCVVGSANLDLVASTQRHPAPGETVLGDSYAEHPGGKGLNQAVAAARSGARVAFVGALGDDAAGDRLQGVLAADAIDDAHVLRSGEPTGRALIVVDANGENSIVVVPGANHAVAPPSHLPQASVVLAQLEIPLASVVAALTTARAAGATTILNPAPGNALFPELLAVCNIVVPNQHEQGLIGGPAALLAGGCEAVVVTRGAQGVDVHTADGVIHVDAFHVDVVDTTGAGDAFCGSLAARLAAGDTLTVAVRWAAAAGALAVTVAGAVPAQPTADAVRHLLAQQPEI